MPAKFRDHRLAGDHARRVIAVSEMVKAAEKNFIPMAHDPDGLDRRNAIGNARKLGHGGKIGVTVVDEKCTRMTQPQFARRAGA